MTMEELLAKVNGGTAAVVAKLTPGRHSGLIATANPITSKHGTPGAVFGVDVETDDGVAHVRIYQYCSAKSASVFDDVLSRLDPAWRTAFEATGTFAAFNGKSCEVYSSDGEDADGNPRIEWKFAGAAFREASLEERQALLGNLDAAPAAAAAYEADRAALEAEVAAKRAEMGLDEAS